MYPNILQTYVEVCEDKLFPFTAWHEMYMLIARYRLAGLKIIICMKIQVNASYFEFRGHVFSAC
jgi:hypothetical protein